MFFVFFKKFHLNNKEIFEFLDRLIDKERLLWVVVTVVSFSIDKPVDFHDFHDYNESFEMLSKVVLHYWKRGFSQ